MPPIPAADPALDALLASVPASTRELLHAVRALVYEIEPTAQERVWPGWRNVGYATGPAMADVRCMLSPAARWVRVSFTDAALPDPEKLLGDPADRGAGHHLRLTAIEELARPAVRALLRAAFAERPAGEQDAAPPRAKRPSAGAYQVGASKTVGVPIDVLFGAWADETERRRWLDASFVVRKATENRSLRITWPGGSSVEVLFLPKGEGRSMVQIDHRKLADDAAVERMRAFWKERLAALRATLEA